MNIVLPIILFAAFLGLTARKIKLAHWVAMIGWICVVVGYYYAKH